MEKTCTLQNVLATEKKKCLTIYSSMGSIRASPLLHSTVALNMVDVKIIDIQPLNLEKRMLFPLRKCVLVTSALLSAFFNRLRMIFTALTGHRPCPLVLPSFFACGVRPTPPQKRRNGIQRLCSNTASRYFFALSRGMSLIAFAVSRAVLKRTRKSDPLA